MLFSLGLLFCCIYRYTHSLSCLSDDGQEIDWFVGYKLPNSYDVVFMNPDQTNWKLSKFPINNEGMMKNTFESMFKLINKPDSVIGMYNDEIPSVANFSRYDQINLWWGHLKGAFAFDASDIGFWVIHSVPKLSYSNTTYVYPKTGHTYGQHFLCLTLEKKYLNLLVTQFALARPLFQSAYISPSIKLKFPDLAKLLENTEVFTERQSNVVELQTANKAFQLKHFSKSSNFGKDLYADFVAPTLKKSLDTETWQHDGSLPSACHCQYSVKNIKSIYIEVSGTTITNPYDHAKWAVTVPSKNLVEDTNNWICLGDINRQLHQFKRGGGTMCIMNQQLWQSFYKIIQSIEECNKLITIVTYLCKQLNDFMKIIIQYVNFFSF
ncbi:hypothetical protein MN116_005626 [Schistosoma mekongi]|uniref:Uncharacterized protein n=1 Tax=Schistosoma mekongi TaxID=38744 RepID=A0AAE1ZAK1_SCHME|nr:hypothetical protein MN116_005626 [Schistosoma mekongi]